MSDLFLDKGIKPMLIGAEGDAFDSPDYLYELKLDGERCIAYLDHSSKKQLSGGQTQCADRRRAGALARQIPI